MLPLSLQTFISLLLIAVATADLSSDRAALVAFRSAVGSSRHPRWNLKNPNPCSWSGVVCQTENPRVIELHLPRSHLSGSIPPHCLSKLTKLRVLNLRYNSLTGELPPDMFSSLSNLRSLYLSNNRFSGQLPESLFSVTNLVRVSLDHNDFSGPISTGFNKLTNLGTLHLQRNHFSGSLPDLGLPRLTYFNVSDNGLTGPIPERLSRRDMNEFLGNMLCGPPLAPCG